MNIEGVRLSDIAVHEDDRGFLFELVRASDAQLAHTYMVRNRAAGVIRAFHLHKKQHDWASIVHGSALIVLVREPGTHDSFVLSGERPKMLYVPPGVYHGWMSLEPDTMLFTATSTLYDASAPDDERIPPDSFNDLFGGNPWEIKHR